MRDSKNILVVQTAFLGDVVLTLPLVQIAKRVFEPATIGFVTTPLGAEILKHHHAVDEIIVFDKRGRDSGFAGLFRIAKQLKRLHYDVAFVPHRSLRSALLVWLAKIPRRIGFNKSAGRFLLTDIVRYGQQLHEVERNLSLLGALDKSWKEKELPCLYPTEDDRAVVDQFLRKSEIFETASLVGVAPGTVWNTKRWLKERYAELVRRLANDRLAVAVIGGSEDGTLCEEIARAVSSGRVVNAAGKLSLLQSAELLRRCAVLVSNDSAPMHLAVAMRTPVVAIFGATIPEFGFSPYGENDVVLETHGLSCRPCTIHGGDRCPIKTFVCMKEITVDNVYGKVKSILEGARVSK